MMRAVKITAALLVAASFITAFAFALISLFKNEPPETVHRIPYTAVGIPSREDYPEGDIARAPWDMVLYEGILYLGSGDFDKNTGPMYIYAYNTATGEWTRSEKLPEEEINRFTLSNGVLYAPGIDPRESWKLGNYYTLENGAWQKHRTLPSAVHTFDVISFENMLFAGLGVSAGKSPVVRSTNKGESFAEVPFEKDGVTVDTSHAKLVRTYDLIEFQGTLYATLSIGDSHPDYELYRYDTERGVFVFLSDLSDTLGRIKFNHQRITDTAIFEDELFFVTGKLYATGDMTSFREVKLQGVDLVCDIYTDGDDVYLLTATKANDEEGDFRASVWQAWEIDGKTEFVELFNLYYDVPALSLAVDGKHFYLGLADTTAQNALSGTVLHVEYKK